MPCLLIFYFSQLVSSTMMQIRDTVFRLDAINTYWFNAKKIITLLQIVISVNQSVV